MGIEDIFEWYQQKIGTYDKQQWETKFEKGEHGSGMGYGLSHVQMKTTKASTEFIDLDLATGSSFTKAKPQHGFMKVAKLATLRCLFLPLYAKWWIHQTSRNVFFWVLLTYIAQLINVLIFLICIQQPESGNEPRISWVELAIPLIIMWILSLIHSQIVATTPGLEDKKVDSNSKIYNANSRRRSNIRQSRRTDKSKSTKKGEKVQKKLKFKDSLPEQSSSTAFKRSHLNLRHNRKLNIDDDGFESLNGNGSRTSEEELVPKSASQSKESIDIKFQEVGHAEIEEIVRNKSDNEDNQKTSIKGLPSSSGLPNWKKRGYIKNAKKKEKVSDNSDQEHSTQDHINENNAAATHIKHCKSKYKKCKEVVNASTEPDELSTKRIPRKVSACNTDSESDVESTYNYQPELFPLTFQSTRRNSHVPIISVTSTLDSTGDTEDEVLTSPDARISDVLLNEVKKNSSEWIGVTTNSEDCSFSSDMDDVSEAHVEQTQDVFFADTDITPFSVLSPPAVKATCFFFGYDEIKKADLTMLDISLSIITKVHLMPASMDYFYIGMVFAVVLALLPIICRISVVSEEYFFSSTFKNGSEPDIQSFLDVDFIQTIPLKLGLFFAAALGPNIWERVIIIIGTMQRWILSSMVFFLLSVAERTFKQRFLYAKLFGHLTSSRRARKSELPHFRLNKVRNIKTWLSVRSYLKRRGPQRSVDVIVSTAFIVTLMLLTFLCVELLKDAVSISFYNLEALVWCLGLGVLLLRFMTLGTKINKKYRNLSVLITEQINLHLQMEQKPHKKDELTVANNVLKLAIDLLKELENPFKISGLSANPILYNVTKLVILSALSGVLSEMLGFKLKLHKIKIK